MQVDPTTTTPSAAGAPADMNVALFESESVLGFLNYTLDSLRTVKALRSRLAEAAGCQASYLSQVLAGTATFSVEQLRGISRYLNLSALGWEYLRELGLLARAGNADVREDSRVRLLKIRKEAMGSAEAETKAFSPDDLSWYVSSWQVSAILAAVGSPQWRTVATLSKLLRTPPAAVEDVLRQLVARKFIRRNDDGSVESVLPGTLYLGKGHVGGVFRTGWVLHGIEKQQVGQDIGLQRGGVFACSRQEMDELRETLNAVYSKFFSTRRPADSLECVGYFGMEVFEA